MNLVLKLIIICTLLFVQIDFLFSQQNKDKRRIVAVEKFVSETPTKYDGAITEKVIEIITKSKRFNVVDRTNLDLIKKEQALQKTEEFFDGNRVQQGAMIGADYQVIGNIRMLNIIRLTSGGDFTGYKATLSFNLKIVNTATSQSTEAQSFESKGASSQLTPERAVDEAIRTLEESMTNYFQEEFPVILTINRIL